MFFTKIGTFVSWTSTNTNNIPTPSLLWITIWIVFFFFFTVDTNMNIICMEYLWIYLNIRIFFYNSVQKSWFGCRSQDLVAGNLESSFKIVVCACCDYKFLMLQYSFYFQFSWDVLMIFPIICKLTHFSEKYWYMEKQKNSSFCDHVNN